MRNNHLFICRNVKYRTIIYLYAGRLNIGDQKKENVWPTGQHTVNLSMTAGDENSKGYNIQTYFPNKEKERV